MPKKLERKLRKEAQSKFPGDKDKQDQYVFGAMNNMGQLNKHKKSKTRDRDEHDYDD